ncbi:TPA: hypothetical protein ACGU7P_004591 [Vibrio vulnificus]|uniref:hypothetical protein n=1 Tax=Vibrio TaxID=662 RepID=UPI000A4848F7|nr:MULTISPECIES: hypothetical protein [Vibrio]EHU9460089.1 hypothetical protein [Vibrio vulnificus]MDC8111556.1 hypothetical protein [Vibrio sp. CCUG 15886]HAS6194783.1 hypothetical protein [Vibrio vulnificus]
MKNFFDIRNGEIFTFLFGDNEYKYSECQILAERIDFNQYVVDAVVKTVDGYYFDLLLVGDGPQSFDNGVLFGHYTVERITEEAARDLADLTNAFSTKA